MKLSNNTEWLFLHLWSKSPQTNQSCPGVFIADTIVYRWAQPYIWYYTNEDGQIMRKTKDKVFVENIEQVFNDSSDKGCGITACYMKQQDTSKKHIQQDKIEFEYFDKEGFKKFLYQREKSLDAVLQKFKEPKDKKNSVIKVNWSPQFCILCRKTNLYDLSNNKVPMNDRLVTFEGKENLTNSDSIASPILSNDLEYSCLNIVKHIQEVTGGNIQISRMTLFFKLDEQNRLWLLYTTGITIRDRFNNPLEIEKKKKKNERVLSPILTMAKYNANSDNKEGIDKFQIPQGTEICVDCQRNDKMYKVKFKHIIESFEAGIVQNDVQKMEKHQSLIESLGFELDFLKDNDEDVPPSNNMPYILTKVWKQMSDAKYFQLKENASWLQLEAKVCSECYLKYTQVTLYNPEERKIEKQIESQKEDIIQRINDNSNVLNKKNINAIKDKLNGLQKEHQELLKQSIFREASRRKNVNVKSKFMEHTNKFMMETSKDGFYRSGKEGHRNTKTSEVKSRQQCNTNQNNDPANFIQQSVQQNLHSDSKTSNTIQQQNSNTLQMNSNTIQMKRARSQKNGSKFDPTGIYKSSRQFLDGNNLPRLLQNQSQSICSNSTYDSSKRIDHSQIINTIKDLRQHLKEL